MKITSTEFSAMLRAEGEKLVSGEKDRVEIIDELLDSNIIENDRKKITPAYIRMVMNRVPGIKAVGILIARRVRDHD